MPGGKQYKERRLKGLCVQCGASSPDKTKCARCCEIDKTNKAKRIEERKTKGICVNCPNTVKSGCVVCIVCSANAAKYATNRYHRNKAANVCRGCGAEPLEGKTKCASCTLSASTSHKKIYNDRKTAGVCHICTRPTEEDKVECALCAEKHNERELQYRINLRKEVLKHYGTCCSCCNVPDMGVHEIDHIEGGGTKHIKELGSSSAFYRWLKKNGFPTGFQTLCPTCNKLKHKFGKCPCKDT